MGLCANCPKALDLKQGKSWDLIDSEDGGKQPSISKGKQVSCPSCGLTPADFKEHGRLGCAQCYETFEVKLDSVIRKLHKGGTHVGKVPSGKKREISPEELAALKRRMDEYVSREEYEMAAVVRDQIKSLET
ncbi:UvrB/uvrC motif domain protein [Verrucomicrobiia bacterium DG1235]|nr:UvrB/uvrC motif domain protein [Verrucomicrobiae bacterium DG1235]